MQQQPWKPNAKLHQLLTRGQGAEGTHLTVHAVTEDGERVAERQELQSVDAPEAWLADAVAALFQQPTVSKVRVRLWDADGAAAGSTTLHPARARAGAKLDTVAAPPPRRRAAQPHQARAGRPLRRPARPHRLRSPTVSPVARATRQRLDHLQLQLAHGERIRKSQASDLVQLRAANRKLRSEASQAARLIERQTEQIAALAAAVGQLGEVL